jgi:uncharacterized protein
MDFPSKVHKTHTGSLLMPKTITVGSASAKPGELARGAISAGEMRNTTPLDIPVMVVNGEKEGPTILIACGAHPPEISTLEAARRVVRDEVKPSKLRGSIIWIPVQNPLAYEAAARASPEDGGNISGLYPGDAHGPITSRIANAIWNEAVLQSDYVLDVHCISFPGIHFNILYSKRGKTADTDQVAMDMLQAYGTTILTEGPKGPMGGWAGKFSNECMQRGIPSIIVELTDTRSIVEESVVPGVIGLTNVLKQLKMIEGTLSPQTCKVVNPGHVNVIEDSLRANRAGLLNIVVPPGDPIEKGETLAEIRDVCGEVVEEVKLPFDGYVSCYSANSWVGFQAVGPGDIVADVFHK